MAPASSSQLATEAQAAETIDGGELFRALIDKPRWAPAPPKMATTPEMSRLLEMPRAQPSPPSASRAYDPFSVPDDFGEYMQQEIRRQTEKMRYFQMRSYGEIRPPQVSPRNLCPICDDPRCSYLAGK